MAKKEEKKEVTNKSTNSKSSISNKKNAIKPETKKKTSSKTPKVKVEEKKSTTKVSTTKSKSSIKTNTLKVSTTSKKPKTSSTVTKTHSKSTKSKGNMVNNSTAKSMLSEYYDLPYRYNQTIVKILAQTPTTLFVYWDISDEDKTSLIKIHGDDFFGKSRPVLLVHNLTHNYTFEIEINDFANSWYIKTQEPNCDYVIELGRKYNNSKNEYIYINSSNNIFSPNDHILFENANLGNVLFKNVKTNVVSSKDFGDLKFINNIDKLYGNIYDVYSALYNDELLDELNNPSSGEFYLKK